MSQVVTFEDYLPSPRYDALPWTSVKIEEGASSSGPWTLIDTVALSPLDADPANPQFRNVTTANADDAADLWYRLTFTDAGGDFTLPTFPVQNSSDERPVYASVQELAQILKVSASDRHASLRRVLETSSLEIDSEIGTADISGATLPYGSPPAMVVEVCLERAVEHWNQMSVPWGIVGLGDVAATYTARDTWDRHAHKLAPLKGEWGLA